MTTTAECTCTSLGRCKVCRPPCEYDGDRFFAFIGETPVCMDCWEYYHDQAPLHSGAW